MDVKAYFLLGLLLLSGLISKGQSTRVTKSILPLNSETPVVYQENVKGGFHQVANSTERDAFASDLKETGMIVSLQDSHATYQWDGSAWRQIQLVRNWEEGAAFYDGDVFRYNNTLVIAQSDGTIASGDNPLTDTVNWSVNEQIAENVAYNNTTSALTATTVQAALDELDATIDSYSGGTVTSVGLSLPSEFSISNSPVTASGTLTGDWASQTANYIFAAPEGSAGTPTFRALIADDIPALTASKISDFSTAVSGNSAVTANTAKVTNATHTGEVTGSGELTIAANAVSYSKMQTVTASRLLGNPTASAAVPSEISLGSGLSLSTAGVLTASGSGGTVTSVGLSLPSQFTVSNSPVTGSGTLTGTWASATANYVFAGPSAAAGTPTFRALIADDIPALTASKISDFDTEVSNNSAVSSNTSSRHSAVTLSGSYDYLTLSGQVLTRGQVNLTTDVTGALPVANGGTGSTSKSWVDLTTTQTVGGAKTFSSNATFTGDIAVNGGDLTSSSTTFNLINTTTTTLNIGGAATAITLGSTSTSAKTTIRNNLQIGSPSVGHISVNGSDLTVADDAEFDGDVWVDGTLYTPSDKRLKTKIETLTNVLDKIEQLRGVSFEFKNQEKYAGGPQIGLIAQELQTVFPELVSQGADGYLAVNYTQLNAVLLQAIKEQQQKIVVLEHRMDKQDKLIRKIMAQLKISIE